VGEENRNIYLHDRNLGITGKWTERQKNFSTWQEVEGKAEFPWYGRRSYGWNIYLHDRKLGFGPLPSFTGKWTERQENFSTCQEVEVKA
jgi:hypothetical protein